MTIAKLVLMLVCLMSVTLEPKDAKVTPLLSKDLTDFPGKEGLMITVEYPPGGSDPLQGGNPLATAAPSSISVDCSLTMLGIGLTRLFTIGHLVLSVLIDRTHCC